VTTGKTRELVYVLDKASHGVSESDGGIRGLVLELVDGETLAEHIARERSAARGLRLRG
jgi:hypothetical protein